MSKEALKTLRIIIPGLIILLVTLPFIQPDLDMASLVSSLSLLKGLLYVVPSAVLGSLYYIFGVRGPFLKASLQKIQNNIKDGLLSPFSDDEDIQDAAEELRRGRTLITVFYSFVDNDASLKEKAKNVYLNGLIWSTTADLLAITLVANLVYAGAYVVFREQSYLIVSISLGLVYSLASLVLMPLITKRHIKLGNEQLEHIRILKRAELLSRLQDLVKQGN